MNSVLDRDRSTTDGEADDAEEPFRRAVDAAERGDLAHAAAQLVRSCRLGAPMTLVALGLAARDCGELRYAMEVLATAANAGYPRAAVALAELLITDGRLPEAERVLLDARRAEPDPEVHCALSVVAWLRGDAGGRCRHCHNAVAAGWPSRSCSLQVRKPAYPAVLLRELFP